MESIEVVASKNTDGFPAFAAYVVGDFDLQARLAYFDRDEPFVTACVQIAAEFGIELSEADLWRRLLPQPLDLSRWVPPPVTLDCWPERGWLPACSVHTGSAPAFDWAWFGPDPLRDSFFRSSADRASARPLSRLLRTRTSLQTLVGAAHAVGTVEPSGFIFHMSRCGSTLAAQMLAAVDHHIVAAEPEPFDAALLWLAASGLPVEMKARALRAMAGALGRNRSGSARRFFVKLDSWHAMALPLIRAAFPEVPWIFLYRDPVEVLVSQMRVRGLQTVPGALPPHIFDIADGATLSSERYTATVLARIFDAVLDHWNVGGGMLVNYSDLPQAMETRVPAHFGFVPDAAERAAMRAATLDDAKAPNERFVPDGQAKQAAASTAVRAEAKALLATPYARLEALRLAERDRASALAPRGQH